MNTPKDRPDRSGPHRVAFEKNKNIILKTKNTCGICGLPVDKSLKYPHPLSPVIDHVIPINRNGHPSDIRNLQLAHWQCNSPGIGLGIELEVLMKELKIFYKKEK